VTVIADSGPLIHLASVAQFPLLKRFFQPLYIVPHVFDEVVLQGKGRSGDPELRQALSEQWIDVERVVNSTLVQRLTAPNISETDATVVACALEKRASLV